MKDDRRRQRRDAERRRARAFREWDWFRAPEDLEAGESDPDAGDDHEGRDQGLRSLIRRRIVD